MLDINLLLLFMIIGAIIAAEVRDMLSAIVSLGIVGLGVSTAFLILKAPDLAITQLVVEILCLIILLRAVVKRETYPVKEKRGYITIVVSIIFVAIFLILSYFSLKELPIFGSPIMRVASYYIEQGIQKTGAVNMVAAIILDFRGYDTLGEATVLFTAVIGSLAILRKIGRKKPGEVVKDD